MHQFNCQSRLHAGNNTGTDVTVTSPLLKRNKSKGHCQQQQCGSIVIILQPTTFMQPWSQGVSHFNFNKCIPFNTKCQLQTRAVNPLAFVLLYNYRKTISQCNCSVSNRNYITMNHVSGPKFTDIKGGITICEIKVFNNLCL